METTKVTIPSVTEQISCDWLGTALGAEVASCTVEDSNSGTTGRATLAVSYADPGKPPHRVFVKLPPSDPQQRAFVVSSGMGARESRFYRSLSAEVPVRVPLCYHAEWDDSGAEYIMLLEHLEDSQCSFRNASRRYSMAYVKAILAAFAKLHAQYWQSPRFFTDLEWLQPPLQHEIGARLVASALSKHGDSTASIFRDTAEIYLNNTDAVHRLWNEGTPTLIHGDVHDGNMFFDGDEPGFLDWALLARGPAMRDVGYFLAATLTAEDRRNHGDWLLEYYRQQLLSRGVEAPSMIELRVQNAWHAVYVWVGAVTTLAMGDEWQPVDYVLGSLKRIHHALDQLGSVEALRAHI
jgi:thiamine kinase-like enzyme